MVKRRKKDSRKTRVRKGLRQSEPELRKITASTGYETCRERLRPFGGLLALIKFLDLIGLKEPFEQIYRAPIG